MTAHPRTPARTWLRRLLGSILSLLLGVATLAGLALGGAVITGRSINRPVPAGSTDGLPASLQFAEPDRSASPAVVQPGRRLVVAFVVGAAGTIASDLLAPYDVFASSPAFTTYVVADSATPAPLESAPAVVPTYTFADVDADPALTPDLVVVPGLTRPTGAVEAPLRRWVTRQHDDGAKVLAVCSGALVVAPTGMLDGLQATSHWSRISALEASRPAVDWVRGRRYVEDGSVTTTAAVTSGVPAALHLVAELAGPAEARRVAHLHPELGWTPTQSTAIASDHFTVSDWPVGLDFVLPWLRPTVGIALGDGIGELDVTAAFEVYGQSAAAGTVALATGDTVRTRHGLVLLTTRLADAPRLSRVVVPGSDGADALDPGLRAWAEDRRVPVEPLSGRPGPDGSPSGGGGFSAALQNLAAHTDGATASSTAKMIGYPTSDLGGQHRPGRTVLLGIAGLALAVCVGLAPTSLIRRRRQRRGVRQLDSAATTVAALDQASSTGRFEVRA